MSNEILNRVWFHSPQVKRSRDRLILLALADMANDLGICWPGQNHLKKRCAITKPTLIKGMNWLEANGFIEVFPKKGTNNNYVVRVAQPDEEYQEARRWLTTELKRSPRDTPELTETEKFPEKKEGEEPTSKGTLTSKGTFTGTGKGTFTGLVNIPLPDPSFIPHLYDPPGNSENPTEFADEVIATWNLLFQESPAENGHAPTMRTDSNAVTRLGNGKMRAAEKKARKRLAELHKDEEFLETWKEAMRRIADDMPGLLDQSWFKLDFFLGKGKPGKGAGYARCYGREFKWKYGVANNTPRFNQKINHVPGNPGF